MPSQPPEAAITALESLVNTADRYNASDVLADLGAGERHLRSIGLLPVDEHLDAAALGVVRDLREDLRQLAVANTERRRAEPELLERLERQLATGRLELDLSTGDPVAAALRPAARQSALGSVVSEVAAALYDTVCAGAWQRVKACANPDCQWAFYDRSRSRTGRWCDMNACGNLLKARAYRQRQRGAATP